jgi:cullin 1
MERNMISKLKLRCGGQFTSKVEGMLNDLNIGIDHKTEFDNYYKENDKLGVKMEFEVQVLTTGNWPTYKAMEIHLPPVLSRCVQVFNDFYSNVTTKRRLQWVHSLGNAVVKGVFAGKKSYDFQVTTLQAIVLLSFSNPSVGNIPFEALSENLNMGDENLKRVLHSLSCGTYKILKIMKGDGSPKDKADKSVKSTDCFAYNPQFRLVYI